MELERIGFVKLDDGPRKENETQWASSCGLPSITLVLVGLKYIHKLKARSLLPPHASHIRTIFFFFFCEEHIRSIFVKLKGKTYQFGRENFQAGLNSYQLVIACIIFDAAALKSYSC